MMASNHQEYPIVQYHIGGPMWAGDEQYRPRGWYLYQGAGIDPVPITVLDRYGDPAEG